ncbi:hypothetical protein B0T26DRAFT_805074 [Lasiosphaeria miniovina]|uniref:Uncharacterized protein n=1 Tax=Lasiosphaeria miniovina TaxID=1954250 RepID=A0AA40A4X2_9PEZI|nr:uncharacterized protein B0T26DRAFT_805074 [Lasiosphaeria miniovina]KAK0709332.1 hypothetical protein B0T26DRAFT_805074 [Lasiosphaeria miniovina]
MSDTIWSSAIHTSPLTNAKKRNTAHLNLAGIKDVLASCSDDTLKKATVSYLTKERMPSKGTVEVVYTINCSGLHDPIALHINRYDTNERAQNAARGFLNNQQSSHAIAKSSTAIGDVSLQSTSGLYWVSNDVYVELHTEIKLPKGQVIQAIPETLDHGPQTGQLLKDKGPADQVAIPTVAPPAHQARDTILLPLALKLQEHLNKGAVDAAAATAPFPLNCTEKKAIYGKTVLIQVDITPDQRMMVGEAEATSNLTLLLPTHTVHPTDLPNNKANFVFVRSVAQNGKGSFCIYVADKETLQIFHIDKTVTKSS